MAELRTKVADYFQQNHLSENGNVNLVLKTIFMFALFLTPYFLLLFGEIHSIYGIFIGYLVIGLGQAGVGMTVMHDANHRSYSKNRVINRWMSKSLYLLGGFPSTWQYQHNTMHHGYTNVEGKDEDINPAPVLRLSPHKPLLKIHKSQHRYAWFLYGLMTLLWVTAKDFKQLYRYHKNKVSLSEKYSYPQMLITLIFSKLLYYMAFIVVPMIILPFAWYWIIVAFLIMHFVSGFVLSVIFQTAHVVPTSRYPLPDNDGNMENNWAVHQLFTTSDFAPENKILGWLIGGLNCQVEHHLFPNICHIHYHKISDIVKKTTHKYGLPYHSHRSFFQAVLQHGKMLKKLGQDQLIANQL
ncbi:MAG: acyl-CoA desaturase [Bacteroidales bacterium]|nr:acyl-CoA desaturase [Bacteroidales bacterium]